MRKIKFEDIIAYEDDDYIVVNKPPLISTLEDRFDKINIMVLAKSYCHGAQVCHRLDKETSGVLVISKHPESYRNAAMQFEKRTVEKTYHAVVDGIHDFRNTTVNQPLLVMSRGHVKISLREGKEAITVFDTLKAYKKHTLVACKPETGRMHQIRVHLASLKAAILNDRQYGGQLFFLSTVKRNYTTKKGTEEQPLIKRFALHASEIVLKDQKGKEIRVKVNYPKDFKVLVAQLEKNC